MAQGRIQLWLRLTLLWIAFGTFLLIENPPIQPAPPTTIGANAWWMNIDCGAYAPVESAVIEDPNTGTYPLTCQLGVEVPAANPADQ